MEAIPLILLAAGGSSRMGSPKQLLPYRGSTLLQHAVMTAVDSTCSPIVVVLGAAAERCETLLATSPVQCVVNPRWESGMGGSMRIGLQHVLKSGKPRAVAIMLCDQPSVTPLILKSLLDRFCSDASIVACSYDGIAGVPAVIGREWFDELLAVDDAAGARHLLQKQQQFVVTIPFPQASLDVDTPADYQRLSQELADDRTGR